MGWLKSISSLLAWIACWESGVDQSDKALQQSPGGSTLPFLQSATGTVVWATRSAPGLPFYRRQQHFLPPKHKVRVVQ